MPRPAALNDGLADSLAQGAAGPLAEAPAMGIATIYQGLSHSTALLFESAVNQFQQLGIAAQAATNQGVIQVYSISSMASAVATGRIARGDPPAALSSLAAMIATERARLGRP